jgi:hypothetical protein
MLHKSDTLKKLKNWSLVNVSLIFHILTVVDSFHLFKPSEILIAPESRILYW